VRPPRCSTGIPGSPLHREAVRRPAARQAHRLLKTELTPCGPWLLSGELAAECAHHCEVLAVSSSSAGSSRRPPARRGVARQAQRLRAGLDRTRHPGPGKPAHVLALFLPATAAGEPGGARPGGAAAGRLTVRHAEPRPVPARCDPPARRSSRARGDQGRAPRHRDFSLVLRHHRPRPGELLVGLNRGKQSIELARQSRRRQGLLAAWSAGPTSCPEPGAGAARSPRAWRRGLRRTSSAADRLSMLRYGTEALPGGRGLRLLLAV